MFVVKCAWVVLFCFCFSFVSCKRETATDYLKRGNAFYSEGKYQDAALAFRKAIQKDLRLGEAHYRYALALMAMNEPGKAAAPLRRALTLMPGHEDTRVQLGNVFLSEWLNDPRRPRERYDEIRTIADGVLSSNPNSFGALRQLAYLELNAGDPSKAGEYLRKALAVRPLEADVTVALARVDYDADPRKSEAMLRELIKAKPDFGPAYDVLFQFCIAQRRISDAEQVLHQKRRALPKDAAAVVQLANYYAEASRPEEAGKILENMLANAADFPDRFLTVGDFYAARREYARALSVYKRGADALPEHRKKYETRIANVLLAQNNRGEALRMFESAVQRDPKDADARAARAAIWLDSGNEELLAQAIRELDSLVKEHPARASFSYMLARAYMARGDRKAARPYARSAARNDAALVAARLMVAQIDLADNRPREALPYAVEALQIEPSNVQGRLLLVRALQMSGRIVEARAELDLLLKAAPQHRDAHIQSGYLRIDERKFAEAEAIFRKLFRPGQDDSDAMAGIVQVLYMQKQGVRAVQEVKTELERNPKGSGMKLLLASLAARTGDQALALRQYSDLLSSGVRNAGMYTSAAELYYRAGRLHEAIDALRQAYALAPARSELAVALGGMVEQAGRPDEARALYRQALKTDPENAAAMNNLAYNLAEGGQDLNEALELAKKAVQLRADPNFSHTLGWVYLKKNLTDSATQIFRNLAEKQPERATFRLHLGMALLAKGDRPGARRELEQALRTNPSSREAAQIQSLLNQTRM